MLAPITEQAPKFHDVVVVRKKTVGKAHVLGVPPEEFGIEPFARNIRDSNYCFHDIVTNTEADLIEQGYDAKQVKSLPTYAPAATSEGQRRDSVDESQRLSGDTSGTRIVKLTEHYIRMDYKGDGKVCLYKVTTGGNEGQVLTKKGKPDIIEFDAMPFAAMTPVIITHRFYGRSLADLVMDIQRIKTALLRALLDNAYLANNRRVEVPESHASTNTLDDLLVSRPGGIVRTKAPGGLREIDHSDIGGHVYPLLEYQDATREWRTGVTKQGQGIDANALQNQSATAVNQAFTASQARVRLIARIFAETGIKDLFWLLHATIRKHADQESVVRLRNKWITVNPRNWKARNDLTVTVGLGTGSKTERLMHMQMLAGIQKELVLGGKTHLVDDAKLYNTAKEITKALSLPNVDAYFNNPTEVDQKTGQLKYPAPPPQPDPKLVELQAKNEIEKTQAHADIATNRDKANLEMTQMRERHALDIQKLQAEAKRDEQKHQMQMTQMAVKAASQPKQTVKDAEGNESVVDDGGQNNMAPLLAMLMEQMKPKGPMRVVRDAQNRVSHLEPM